MRYMEEAFYNEADKTLADKTGFPERQQKSHPWKYSRLGCMGSGATWTSRCPLQRGWNQMISKVPSNTEQSMILSLLQQGKF